MWRQRLTDATAAAAGRTGAVFEAINPRTRPITVDGARVDTPDGPQWRTDGDSIRQSAAKLCASTVALTAGCLKRGTYLSPEERAAGRLDDHFQAPELANVRAALQQRKAPIEFDELVLPWTESRLAEAVKNCDDSAPGPSGLTYWMMGKATESWRSTLALMMNSFQERGYCPPPLRHGYVYPIPKLGEGGSTFEGARQIVLLEVVLKLISGGIAERAMAIWESRGDIHASQHGFRKGRYAGLVASFVTALHDLYRRQGKPLYTVALDLTKAFQSVGLPAIEGALRRMGVPERAIALWMQTDFGEWLPPAHQGDLWAASYGTCQVITGAGLSPDFPTQTGVRQGERASAIKFLVWIELLWAFLDLEGVVGAPVDLDNPEGERVAFLGFADDIWAASDNFEELQRTVTLIDRFMAAFDVELSPKKSLVAITSPGPRDAHRAISIRREVAGKEVLLPLQRVEHHDSYRYLGIMLQPDGRWQAMESVVLNKVRAWTTKVRQVSLPVDQAVMVLRSVVGGLLNYVLTAAPLSEVCMRKIDKMVAAAVFSCAGLARGRRTTWAFLPLREGGFGATSAQTLRRAVVLEKVLSWLNGQAYQHAD